MPAMGTRTVWRISENIIGFQHKTTWANRFTIQGIRIESRCAVCAVMEMFQLKAAITVMEEFQLKAAIRVMEEGGKVIGIKG